jgi:hypothetical protein
LTGPGRRRPRRPFSADTCNCRPRSSTASKPSLRRSPPPRRCAPSLRCGTAGPRSAIGVSVIGGRRGGCGGAASLVHVLRRPAFGVAGERRPARSSGAHNNQSWRSAACGPRVPQPRFAVPAAGAAGRDTRHRPAERLSAAKHPAGNLGCGCGRGIATCGAAPVGAARRGGGRASIGT